MRHSIYLAGPMRGKRDFNFPAFYRAAKKLRAAGHFVFNPAAVDEAIHGRRFNKSVNGRLSELPNDFSLRHVASFDLQFICLRATAIALLPGWEKSSGAKAELEVAKWIGLEILYL